MEGPLCYSNYQGSTVLFGLVRVYTANFAKYLYCNMGWGWYWPFMVCFLYYNSINVNGPHKPYTSRFPPHS